MKWTSVLELDAERDIISGGEHELCEAIRGGADLRVYTEFRHNEHIEVSSDSSELVKEVSEFPVTCLLDDCWTAGFMTLRQPVSLPDAFGPRASMSFFLYNQNGQQAIARPHLDGPPACGLPGVSPLDEANDLMPKYHQHDSWDAETNAPSSNFVYDFGKYRFHVRDDWQEVFSHARNGAAHSGSIRQLSEAFCDGCEIKVGIRGLYQDLDPNATGPGHEVFVRTHSGYYYSESERFIAGTHPLVRVRPAIPLAYASHAWDFGWIVVRTDGFAARLLYDPYSLKPVRSEARYEMRWFVR